MSKQENSDLLKEDSPLYNEFMNEKKYYSYKNKYCLWILCLFIVSGCANKTKQSRVIGIQKIRIKRLEQQLAAKNKIIEDIKTDKLIRTPPPVPLSKALLPLKKKMRKKQWVSALKLSSELKKQYPTSLRLAKYRIAIFKKMGLEKQASSEVHSIKKIISSKRKAKRIH